jgi:putative endonuclease
LSKLNQLGNKGEQIAQLFLKNKGYTILHTNFRFQHKEVDIICIDKDTLVFCEIKTRTSTIFGFPEDAVTKKKQNYLKLCAEHYLLNHPQYNRLRFDVISIILNKNITQEIVHIEDAFY